LAGIYIHIPFCNQACHYCNFHFSTSLKHKDRLIEAILKEIDQRAPLWKDLEYNTIYFGGGTPSLLPVSDIEKIKEKLYGSFKIALKAEITLEANPDDLTAEKINIYKRIGINRLSIGIQSFYDEDLKNLNRTHNGQQAETAIINAQNAGIYNISVDLIYGIPGLSHKKWLNNIDKVIKMKIPHISAYALTVEPKTALEYKIKKGLYPRVSDEQAEEQFIILKKKLSKENYEQYEISNFALKGWESKHNSSYWQNKAYLGIGPSAHSYKNNIRRWNVANNQHYIKKINTEQFYETELLTPNDRFNEMIMTGLRTKTGVNINQIQELGKNYYQYIIKETKRHISNGNLIIEKNYIKATENSLFIIENIIRELFII